MNISCYCCKTKYTHSVIVSSAWSATMIWQNHRTRVSSFCTMFQDDSKFPRNGSFFLINLRFSVDASMRLCRTENSKMMTEFLKTLQWEILDCSWRLIQFISFVCTTSWKHSCNIYFSLLSLFWWRIVFHVFIWRMILLTSNTRPFCKLQYFVDL